MTGADVARTSLPMKVANLPDVAIIGAGVSGLTCGVLLAERGYRAAIFAEELGERTTSAAAAAIWFPYDADPADKVIAWSLGTYEQLRALARQQNTGVSMIELRCFARSGKISIPDWAKSLGAGSLIFASNTEISANKQRNALESIFSSGFTMIVPLTDTTRYLDYLRERFANAGGAISGGVRLETIGDISPRFEVIVNCAGIGSAELVPDPEMEPHRGQVAIVSKLDLPWAIVCDDPPLMYAIPRAGDCVFGGTNSISYDRQPIRADTDAIVAECSRTLNIEPPPVIATRVGLRPFRKSGVRLESNKLSDGRIVVHNYGHGGSGFTLSWGCAEEVLKLLSLSSDTPQVSAMA
jgi:D-amino-acid oxidase